jgi:glycosyltransferase involved in cell wall biosynthesis
MKNILFVSPSDFPSNSAVHIHHFANELVILGFDCIVAVPNDRDSVSQMQYPLYRVTQFDQIDNLINLFENHQAPDIVHAWTPRELVRRYCMLLEESFQFKLIIHLEDNESTLLERFSNSHLAELSECSVEQSINYLSHPQKYRDFLNSADGVTVIMDRLQELIADQVPRIVIWPGVDPEMFFPRPKNLDLARHLGIPSGSTVLCYTGNIHPANVAEVKSLYRTVGNRNRQNKPTVLLRSGVTSQDFLDPDEQWIHQYVIDLGFVDREKIPELLALADVLVQPGEPDAFNNYRLPSKIPEFLAMGKPVILPHTNIGRFLTHKENAIVLPIVDEVLLSDAIDLLLNDRALAQKLSDGAVAFAKTQLNWRDKGQQLKSFYLEVMCQSNQERSCRNAFYRMQRWTKDLHEEIEQTQMQLEQTQMQLEQTQLQLEQTQLQLEQTQMQLEQTQLQLEQTQMQLEQTQMQLEQTQLHLEVSQNLIEAMESSKFWQIRKSWFRLKRIFGIPSRIFGISSDE